MGLPGESREDSRPGQRKLGLPHHLHEGRRQLHVELGSVDSLSEWFSVGQWSQAFILWGKPVMDTGSPAGA